jgi:hypothetical protein
MPSFALLSEDELEALVSYVIHLNIRGQTERALGRILVQSRPSATVKRRQGQQSLPEPDSACKRLCPAGQRRERKSNQCRAGPALADN